MRRAANRQAAKVSEDSSPGRAQRTGAHRADPRRGSKTAKPPRSSSFATALMGRARVATAGSTSDPPGTHAGKAMRVGARRRATELLEPLLELLAGRPRDSGLTAQVRQLLAAARAHHHFHSKIHGIARLPRHGALLARPYQVSPMCPVSFVTRVPGLHPSTLGADRRIENRLAPLGALGDLAVRPFSTGKPPGEASGPALAVRRRAPRRSRPRRRPAQRRRRRPRSRPGPPW